MTTSEIAASATKSSPRSLRQSSIISRLVSPFASKQHSHIKHDIELQEPFRHYSPGDTVKGAVHLRVGKPVRATHLVVRLHGFVKVVSHSRLPGELVPYDEHLLNSSKGRRGREYFGNGFARLFEDEVVLCGDGRLLGHYVFRFELDLPRTGIPSSIDFENGTITYLLTSTLTRPTAISPTLVKDAKLKVKENIDIAPIPVPKPQSVSLEAVRKRRPVMHMKRKLSEPQDEAEAATNNQHEPKDGSLSSPVSTVDAPHSPAPSELSAASLDSTNTSSVHATAGFSFTTDIKSSTNASIIFATSDKTITAQTEILQGGCLPGDTLPIKVSVDHTTAVKSMQGVIITFYRSARVDTHPALPLGPSKRHGEVKYEDYYPKSRTGLGGLSLSSAGSSRTFRQDLAQTITPLMVDPQSLTAIVKTSILVPEHIFPTIDGVPGNMIVFKYFIEVVIDLRGKLGQDRLLPKFSMTETPQCAYDDPRINVVDGQDGMTFSATPGFNYLITDQIRRQKGVIHTKTEIIVGTRDSTRSRCKQKVDNSNVRAARKLTQSPLHMYHLTTWDEPRGRVPEDSLHQREYPRTQSNALHYEERPFPPPQPEEPQDEKARIRRAEQALLPSAPPQDGEGSLSAGAIPSAPVANDEDDFIHRYGAGAPAPAYDSASLSSPSPRATYGAQTQPTSFSSIEEHQHESQTRTAETKSTDTRVDKQELERQRLQSLASSPDVLDNKDEPDMPTLREMSQTLPSAPSMYEFEHDEILVEEAPTLDSGAGGPASGTVSDTSDLSTMPLPHEQRLQPITLRHLSRPPIGLSNDNSGSTISASVPALAPSASDTGEHDVNRVQNDDADEQSHEDLPVYKR